MKTALLIALAFFCLLVPEALVTANKFVVAPNPVTDVLHVIASDDARFTVCDLTGRMITTGSLRRGDNSVSLNELSAGLYLLKVADADGVQRSYRVCRQ